MTLRSFPTLLLAGFVVWSSSLVVLYALSSLGCARGWPDDTLAGLDLLTAVLGAAWVAHVALFLPIGIALARLRRRWTRSEFASVAMANALALAATIWTGLPVLAGLSCA